MAVLGELFCKKVLNLFNCWVITVTVLKLKIISKYFVGGLDKIYDKSMVLTFTCIMHVFCKQLFF